MSKVTITSEVKEVLSKSNFEADRVTLPNITLARPLYMAVAKVLDAQGGKWNKKARCHIFPSDPREIFREALENGSIVHAAKTRQAFYTPPDVVSTVMAYAAVERCDIVLEPSAGDGAFSDAIREQGARVTCVENDDASIRVLIKKGHEVLGVDFLSLTAEGFAFDMVIMNPPFTKGQDAKHVTHALKFVKPGGQVFAIVPTSYEHNDREPYLSFRALIERQGRVVEKFENHEFRCSGTDIATRLICLTA